MDISKRLTVQPAPRAAPLWKQLLIPHNPPHTAERTIIPIARSPLRLDKLHNLTQLTYSHPSLFKGVSTPRTFICQLRDYALPHPTEGGDTLPNTQPSSLQSCLCLGKTLPKEASLSSPSLEHL